MWRVAREATRQTRWLVLGQTKSVGTDGSRLEGGCRSLAGTIFMRSEEHTSELQSLTNLVCRLLLEKKKSEISSHEQSEIIDCHGQDTTRALARSVTAT